MSLFSKKSKFSKETLSKHSKKKYKKPISLLHKSKRGKRSKFKKRQSPIRKLSKLLVTKSPFNKDNGLNKFVVIAIVAFITLGTIYFVFFTRIFDIKTIEIFEGETETSNSQIRKIIEPIRGRNILLIESEAISQSLRTEIDNLAELSVKKIPPSTVKITFARFSDAANFITIDEDLKRTRHIINETGVITEISKTNPDLPSISLQTNSEFQLGDQGVTQSKLNYILELAKAFEEKFSINVTEAAHIQAAREVHLVTELGFIVWIDMEQPYEPQLNKLKNSIPKIDIYNDQFEYIDLRIESANGEKIIFKRR